MAKGKKKEESFDYDHEIAWYIVHTKIGCEEFVKESLEALLETRGLNKTLFEMFIPYEDAEKKKTIYPGYLFIKAIMEPETWYIIRNTRYVFGFIGSSGKGARPIPVFNEEIAALKIRCGLHSNAGIEFVQNEKVKILSGPFEGKIGTVSAVKDSVLVLDVEFFNSTTQVEVDINNVEKENN